MTGGPDARDRVEHELALADWREGVHEAVAAYRAAHGDQPVTGGLAAGVRRAQG